MFKLLQYSTTLSASGCSDNFSNDPLNCNTSSSLNHSQISKSVTFGFHSVNVQVLSKNIVFTFQAISKLSASLISIQFSAHFHVHIIIAVGVASHNAQGQAIINTDTKLIKAKLNDGSGQIKYQTINVSIAIQITVGTKIEETKSASFCIGAFEL